MVLLLLLLLLMMMMMMMTTTTILLLLIVTVHLYFRPEYRQVWLQRQQRPSQPGCRAHSGLLQRVPLPQTGGGRRSRGEGKSQEGKTARDRWAMTVVWRVMEDMTRIKVGGSTGLVASTAFRLVEYSGAVVSYQWCEYIKLGVRSERCSRVCGACSS